MMGRGLTQEERFTLATVQRWRAKVEAGNTKVDRLNNELKRINKKHRRTLRRLAQKGGCASDEQGWHVQGS